MEDALGISLGVGALIACALSAYSWETRPRLRLLPVLYCAFAGVVVAICIWDQNNLAAVMKAAALFALVGLGLTFALWVQIRSGG